MSEYCPQPNDPENNDPEYPPEDTERPSDGRVVNPDKAHAMALAGDKFERRIAIETAFGWGIHDAIEGTKNEYYRDTRKPSDKEENSDADGNSEVSFSELDKYYTRGLKNGSFEDAYASRDAKQKLRAKAHNAEEKAAARYEAEQQLIDPERANR